MKHRRTFFCILFLLFGQLSLLYGQQLITVNVQGITVDSLKTIVAYRTGYTLYHIPAETDSVRINLYIVNQEPAALLRQVTQTFRDLDFSVNVVNNKQLFVVKGVPFSMTLPVNYFGARPSVADSIRVVYATDQEKEIIQAQSESKLYTIGAAALASRPGRALLNGYLKDIKTGESLTGIIIYADGTNIQTTSDAFGFYSLSLPKGEHKIHFKGYGFVDTYRLVQMNGDGNLDVDLREQVFTLTGATVSAEKMSNIRSTQMGLERIRIDRIKRIPTVFGEADVIKVVLTLPGVKSVGEAAGGFNVRGGATDQNLILFNEGTVYNPTHLFGLFSSFNPDIVSDIELYKSSIPANYGGRISSVLEVNSREGNKKKITGSAGLGLLTSKLHVEGPIAGEETSFILGGRTTYSNWLLKLLPDDSEYKNGTASFYDLNGMISHKMGVSNMISVNGYYSKDKFKFDANTIYGYQNSNVSVKWRNQLNRKLYLTTSAGYDHYSYDVKEVENAVNAYTMAFGINQYFGKLNFNWFANEKHSVRFGFHTIYYALQPGSYLPQSRLSLVTPQRLQREQATENALYISDTWNISYKFSIEAGLRFSLYSALGPRTYYQYQDGLPKTVQTITDSLTVSSGKAIQPYFGPEIRVSARYMILPDLSIKVGFNSMRQHIHMLSNTTTASPTDIWKLSDANIVPQTGWQAAGGIYKNFANNTIEASLEGYYKVMNHYLDYRSAAVLVMNPHVETDVLEARGKAYGAELLIKKNLGKLNGWITYAYSRTMLQQNDPTAVNPVNNGDWYPAAYDKPHDVKVVANYKFTHRYSVSLNVDYATGRPVTIPVSKYMYGDGYRVFYSDRNAYRIPDYFRIDLAVNIEPSHHLVLLTHSSLTFGVYNITGRKNAYSVYYNANNKGIIQGYMLSIFGAPIPYISYNIKF